MLRNDDAQRGVLLDRPHERLGVGHPALEAHGSLGHAGRLAPGRISARCERVLELVEVGPTRDQVDDALDRCGWRRSASPCGPVHDPDEHGLVVGDERGDAEGAMVGDAALVLLAERLERGAGRTSANTASASTPCSRRISRSTCSSRMSRLSSWRAAKSARCTRRKASGQRSRTAMPTCMASSDDAFSGSSHTSGSPSSTWTWFSENGHEGDVPVGARLEAGDHVLVGVAGEGAAVVPGDGELDRLMTALQPLPAVQDSGAASDVGRRRQGHELTADATEGDADGRADDDVGRVVDLHVDAAGGHDDRDRVVQRPERVVLGEQAGGAERRRGVAARKAAGAGRRRRSGRSVSHGGRVRRKNDLMTPLTSTDSRQRRRPGGPRRASRAPSAGPAAAPRISHTRLKSPRSDAT